MQKLKILTLLCFGSLLGYGQAAVDAFTKASNMKRANISFLVKEVETGNIVMQHRADKVAVPASTTKLVTTASALEILGPDYTCETKLQYDGTIDNGVLYGNIYILGSGDPTLGSRYMGDSLFLDKWVAAVKQLGITKITGTVIADASIFNTEGIAPKWSWEDMGNYYAAGAYGISIYDNTYKLYLKTGAPGTTPEIVGMEPNIPELSFKLHLKAKNNDEDSAYIYGAPNTNERLVYGTIPANKTAFVIKGDIPNPPLYAAQVFAQRLKDNGVELMQKPTTEVPENRIRTAFFTEVSPPLKDILTNINFKSNNHYSEHVLRLLSAKGEQQGSLVSSFKRIKSFWKEQGLDTNGLIMYDGCGLSAANAISASFFVDLLIYEKTKSPYNNEFLSSLPVAGESGTIKSLLKGTQLEGRVQAKSGSIFGVQCFAGYIYRKNKTYAFAILVNNYAGIRKNVLEQIEQLLLSVGK